MKKMYCEDGIGCGTGGANTVCSQDVWVLLGDNVMIDINSLIRRWAACYDDVE